MKCKKPLTSYESIYKPPPSLLIAIYWSTNYNLSIDIEYHHLLKLHSTGQVVVAGHCLQWSTSDSWLKYYSQTPPF